MSVPTMLLSGLRKNAILTTFGVNIFARNMAPKYVKGMVMYKWNTPGMDILTTGEETVPELDMGCEG